MIEPNAMITIMNTATVVIMFLSIGALFGISRMTSRELCTGWRLLNIGLGLGIISTILDTLWNIGLLAYPYQVFFRLAFVVVGMFGLWNIAQRLNACRSELASSVSKKR